MSTADRAPEPNDDPDPFDPFAGLEDLRDLGREFDALDRVDASADAWDESLTRAASSSDDDADFGLDDEQEREIERICHDALELLEDDECEAARERATDAVRIDDEHPFPLFVLGLIAEREDDLPGARRLADLALQSAATNADTIGLRAHLHVREHEFDAAERLLRFGVAHNPDDSQLHEGLARVALARGHYDDALDAATACLRLEPGNVGAAAVRSAALDERHDRGALLATLRQSVQIHPDDPYSMVELASIEMEHGNLDRARVLLLRAQRLAPRDRDIFDIRILIEGVREHPLLRPVPHVLRWVRDFPGGLAGLLIGLIIAALPLHALATTSPAYAIPVISIISIWGGVGLYAWVAPAILNLRLEQVAADSGMARIVSQLTEPSAPMPSLDRVGDVVSLLVTARRRRAACRLLDAVADRYGSGTPATSARAAEAPRTQAADELRQLARTLRRPHRALGYLMLCVPGDVRLLAAAAVSGAMLAPLLQSSFGGMLAAWYWAAVAAIFLAATITAFEHRTRQRVDDVFTTLRVAGE